jgi:transcription antitermination protein NusB
MNKQRPIARHKARELALQGIYQWQFTQDSLTDIELQFHEDNDMSKVDTDYFSELLHQIPQNVTTIDEHLEKAIDRPFRDLNPVELAVLRIAIYELLFRQDVPYKVIINEALQITKTFGAADGFKYVNGVLDTLSKELRCLEVCAHHSKKAQKPLPKTDEDKA